jgi:Phage tail lysozyme
VNVVKALVVTLGLDPRDYVKGLRDAARARDGLNKDERDAARRRSDEEAKRAREADDRNRRALDGYRRIRNEVLGLVALFTAGRGVRDWVRDLTQGDAAAGRFARTVNLSVQDLGAWEEAAKRVGGSAEGMRSTMEALQQGFMQYRLTGQSDMIPYLRELGLSMDQFVDRAGRFHPERMLLAVNKAFREQRRTAEEQVYFARGLHLDQGATQLMAEPDLPGLVGRMRGQGTADERTAKLSQQLLSVFYDVQQEVQDTARQMLANVTPDLIKLLTEFRNWMHELKPGVVEAFGQAFRRAREMVVAFFQGDGWKRLKADIGAIWEVINRVVERMGGWTRASEVFLGLWVLGKVTPAALGVGMLAMAFGRLGSAVTGIRVPTGLLGLLGRLGIGGLTAGGVGALLATGARDHGLTVKQAAEQTLGTPEEFHRNVLATIRRGLSWLTGGHMVFDRDDEERRFNKVTELLQQIERAVKEGQSYAGGIPGQDTPRERVGAGLGDTSPQPRPLNLGGSSFDVRRKIQYMHDTLIAKGWPEHVVAGIIANALHENRDLDPAKPGDHGSALGIMQWHADRVAHIENEGHIRIRGGTFEDQVEAVDWELRNREAAAGRALRATRNAREAGEVASRVWIRPKLIDKEADVRGRDADQLQQRWGAHAREVPRPVSARDSVEPYRLAAAGDVTHFHGPINIHTQATDAAGIRRDLFADLRRRGMMAQSATGLA